MSLAPTVSAPPPRKEAPVLPENPKRTRTIKVDYLARVECEGGIRIRVKAGRVEDVKLSVFEPPR